MADHQMKVELLATDDPKWMSVLQQTMHDFHHLPSYGELCGRMESARCQALLVTGGGRCVLLPLLIRDLPGGRRDAVSPYGYPGPLVTGPDSPSFLADALAEGVRRLRDEGFVSMFLRMHPLLNPIVPSGIGTIVEHGDTVSVDLGLSEDTLWKQTRRGHRHDIMKSQVAGCLAELDEQWQEYAAFRRLYEQTMLRRAAAPYYHFGDAYFEALRAALGDRLHLCVVRLEGAVGAAGLFVETCGIVQYHLSGSDEAFASLRPTKLMLHHVARWARGRGNRVLHLGGGVGGRGDSLLEFKAGFSPLRHRFSTLRVVIDERAYENLVRARDPDLDPSERSGYFPLYRSP